MTFLPRKVALAPDRDDHDDAQAAMGDDGGESPPGPASDTSAGGSEAGRDSGAEGGDTDTEGTTGTIAGGIADAASDPVLVAQGDDADTEGTIAEVWDPATDAPAADAGEASDPVAPDAVDNHVAAPNVAAPKVVSGEVSTPDPAAQYVGDPEVANQGFADQEVVAREDYVEQDVVDPDSVGYDGRSPVEASDDAQPDDVDDEARPATPGPRSHKKAVAALTMLSLVVVGAGVGGVIWSRNAKNEASPPPATQAPSPSPTLSDGAFVTFKDSEAGFSMRYPRGWTRSEAPLREIRLQVSDGKQFSARVQVIHTEVATTAANLANIKAVADGVVGPGVQILKEDPITVNDLVGFRYIYTFTDKDSGLTTAHLHYFLFQGHKMNSIVFEAVPGESFSRIEGVFDQMLGSFHSDPEPP